MNPDVVEELREWIDDLKLGGWDGVDVLEHALAEILRLNDILEVHRAVQDEMYGRNSNAKSNELFK